MNAPRYRSAFEDFPGPGGDGAPVTAGPVALRPRLDLGLVDVKGDPADGTFARAVESVLGIPPPSAPGAVAAGDRASLLWLAPGHWLAVVDREREERAAAALEAAFAPTHASATRVGDQYAAIGISGTAAGEVLAAGCALDLDPGGFPPGRVAGTLLARVRVVLWCVDEADFTLLFERSFAEFVWRWLEDAATGGAGSAGTAARPGAA